MSSASASTETAREAGRSERRTRSRGRAAGPWTEYTKAERSAIRLLFVSGAPVTCPRCDGEVELRPASRDLRGAEPCARGYDAACGPCRCYYLCLRPTLDGARRSQLRRLARAVLQA